MPGSGSDDAVWGDTVAGVVWRLGGIGLMAVLGISVLGKANGGPEWITPRHVSAAMILLAGALVIGNFLRSNQAIGDADFIPYRFSVQLLLFIVLLILLANSDTAGYGLVFGRTGSAIAVFLILMAFCVLARDPREYSFLQWVVIGCLGIVLAIFFYHARSISFWSGQARFPFWYGSIMAIGLVVVPQYLSRAQFLWAVNRYAAVLVVLALPVYFIGEYTLWGLEFGFLGAYTIPVVGIEVPAARSLFVNRNAFAVAVFGGLVAAIGEFLWTYRSQRPRLVLVVPGSLLMINAVGLALSYGRALWVITPMAMLVYLAYLVLGHRSIPLAVVAAFVYLASGIVAVQSGILPLPDDTPTRARNWYPTLAALRDHGSILGAGFVDLGEFVARHEGTQMSSPHNSYLSMTIQAGLLGGFSYLLLIASSLLSGVLEVRQKDALLAVAMIALGVGFAAHHQFEAYRLFNWAASSVLAVFVFGFLAFGVRTSQKKEIRSLDWPRSS